MENEKPEATNLVNGKPYQYLSDDKTGSYHQHGTTTIKGSKQDCVRCNQA